MDQFKSLDNLNMFERAVCLKSKPLKDVSLSSISIFWKIVIITVLVWAIVTTAVNIAAYVKILHEPDNDQNLSSSWCIAMLIFNGFLLFVSFALIVVVIISFKKDADAKKIVQLQEEAAMTQGASMGAAAGAPAAVQAVTAAISNAAGNAAATAVMNLTNDPTAATAIAKQVQSAAATTGLNPTTTSTAAQAAVTATNNATSSGTLSITANANVSSPLSTRGTLGSLLPPPTSMIGASSGTMKLPGGPANSVFNQTAAGDFLTRTQCDNGSNPPCGISYDYIANLNHDLNLASNNRFLQSQWQGTNEMD